MNPRKSTSSFSNRRRCGELRSIGGTTARHHSPLNTSPCNASRGVHGCSRVQPPACTPRRELASLIALVGVVHQQERSQTLRAKTGQQLTPSGASWARPGESENVLSKHRRGWSLASCNGLAFLRRRVATFPDHPGVYQSCLPALRPGKPSGIRTGPDASVSRRW